MNDRFNQLLESKLGNVKPLISEVSMTLSPYVLTPKNGNVEVKNVNTGEIKIFSLEVKKFVWIDLTVLDFPDGNKIKVSAVGQEKTNDLDGNELLKLITTNWNNKNFEFETKTGDTLRFTKV